SDISDFGHLKCRTRVYPSSDAGEGDSVVEQRRRVRGSQRKTASCEEAPSPILCCCGTELPSPARGEGNSRTSRSQHATRRHDKPKPTSNPQASARRGPASSVSAIASSRTAPAAAGTAP